MTITNRMTRRLFLGGAGALVALPALELSAPRRARADTPPAPPTRFFAFYVPCGIRMAAFTPKSAGPLVLTPTLASLEKVKGKINVVTGLDNLPARPDGAGDHASGTSGFLTCRHVVKTDGAGIKNGISADQVIANAVGKTTHVPSLQLGIDGGGSTGGCDSGYSCAYTTNVSWASETKWLPKTTDPKAAFDSLFSGFDPGATSAENEKRRLYRTSILDYVLEDAKSLGTRLSVTDRARVEEYMDAVRELEKRIDGTSTGPACTVPGKPAGGLPFQEHVAFMLDLSALAFRCDITRVITFMLGNAGSGRSFEFLPGASGAHHELSHHGGDPGKLAKLEIIDQWEVSQLAYLLEKLDAIKETTGTVLDNSVVFFSSEIEDGDAHRHTNMPVVLGGGAGGAIPTGRHLVKTGAKTSELMLTLIGACGASATSFGDDGKAPLSLA